MASIDPAVLSDLGPLIEAGGIVAIGELHGTVQFPMLVEAIVGVAVGRGVPVIVGLELPMTEQPNTGEFGSFWHRDERYRDGRSSEAMANLVTTLASIDDVQIVAMDGPWVAPGSPVPLELMAEIEQPRDAVMAGRILDVMDRSPKAFTLMLAGPMHTRVSGSPQPTLGSMVRAWHPKMIALMGQASGGESWVLARDPAESGAYPLPERAIEPGAIWASEPAATDGHHGFCTIGVVTASPPFTPDES